MLASLTLPYPVATAQQNFPEPAAAQEQIVREIKIEFAAPATVSEERILANMATAVGKPYSRAVVEQDTENLFKSGLVENVRIFEEPMTGGVRVIVIVEPRATIGEIVINGADQVSERRVRRELAIKTGQPLREAEIESERQKILKVYVDRGFADTDVAYTLEPIAATGNVRVVFTVLESGKQFISKVEFEGNTVFTDKQLAEQMKTKKKGFLSFLSDSGRLRQEELDEDLLRVQQFYQDEGYIDAEVGPVAKDAVGKNKVALTIQVKEGGTYTIGKMTFSGQTLISEEEIRGLFKEKEGDMFKQKTFRADIQSLRDYYGSRGYVDANITPELKPAGASVVDIDFRIEEGLLSYLGRVNIDGNTKTKDKVIRRELAAVPGDVYDTVKIEASKKRLQGLGYFSKVEAFPSDTTQEGVKDLNLIVEEKQTGSLQFGAGFSSIDELVGFAEIQQSNFDIKNWPSFTGGGQRFRIRGQFGTRRSDFVLSLTEPWFLDQRLSLGGELFFREANFVSDVYDQRNIGASITLRKPINDFTDVRLEYRLEQIEIMDVDGDASQFFQDQEGDYLRSVVKATVGNDTRNDLYLPRTGHRIEASARYAGLGGDVELYGLEVQASQYFSLPYDLIFFVEGELAVVDETGGDDVPVFDRLYLGGANDLRGFDYRDVGPKDEFGEPIGGKSLARVTAELTFPVVTRVRGAIFYDAGSVSADSFDFGSDFNANVGIGVRLDLPIGPIRLDYGIPISSDEFNDSDGRFNFNVGYRF
jgi:outer membrane protein insertion porin family